MKNYIIKDYIKRILIVIIGLVFFSVGVVLNIKCMLGNSPWNAFHGGFSNLTGISIGNINIITGIFIVIINIYFKEPIGIGTLCNMVAIGAFTDIILKYDIIKTAQTLPTMIIYMILSVVINAVATYFYMSANLGTGPRDGLMIVLSKRIPSIKPGYFKNVVEIIATAIGFIFGAPIGIGTIVTALGVGPILQFMFKITGYDPREQRMESVPMTLSVLRGDLISLPDYKKQQEKVLYDL